MKKIYGYKEEDIINLAQFIKGNNFSSLSEAFEKFASFHGKAKGTIRNMYYALAKASSQNKEFCEKYLGGVPISVSKITAFDEDEERKLVKSVLEGRKSGKSARSIINELSNGDAKTALRYQNKYRNAIKNKGRLVAEVIAEIKEESGNFNFILEKTATKSAVSDAQFSKLKNEIDALIGRIGAKTSRENEYLKMRVQNLELENIRLNNLLYGNGKVSGTIGYFLKGKDKDVLN